MKGMLGQDLSLTLGGQTVLSEASMGAESGEIVGLLGPNGSGKTTLLKCLAGLLTPVNGKIVIDDMALSDMAPASIARRIAYLEQDASSDWPLSVHRVVSLGRMPWLGALGKLSDDDMVAIEDALTQCDVLDLADRDVTTLSGGERARVMLARALAATPEILLADEPVSQLDPYHQLGVMAVLQKQAQAGSAVITVMHDLSLAARYCDRVCLMHKGKIAADGLPEDVLVPETLADIFAIEADLFQYDGQNYVLSRKQYHS